MEQEQYNRFGAYRVPNGSRVQAHSGVIPGVILVAVGAIFFLNNLHIFYIRDWFRFWPTILIAAGIVKLVDSEYPGGRVFGGTCIAFGGIFLARNLGFIDVGMRELWPLIPIGLGLMLLVQRTGDWALRIPNPVHSKATDANTLNTQAIFGGVKRVVNSQEFRGGEVLALFGGVELDLRQADMSGDSAVLEINAILGGVELKMPLAWTPVVQGVSIFGGYGDSTVQPNPARIPGAKQLFIRGAAIFGGVEIKN